MKANVDAVDDVDPDMCLSMTHVLAECDDFSNEITHLEDIAWRRGHIIQFTAKGAMRARGRWHRVLLGQGHEVVPPPQ